MSTESVNVAGQRILILDDGRQVPAVALDPKGLPSYDTLNQMLTVGNSRAKLSEQFFAFDTTNTWRLVQTGAGMAVTLGGATSGARYLQIAMGTTPNSETVILSRQTFSLPLRLSAGVSISNRIANQQFLIDLVEVDAAGNVVTDAAFPAPTVANARNAAGMFWDGVSSTLIGLVSRGSGISETISLAGTATATSPTGTTPNLFPSGLFELLLEPEEAYLTTRPVDAPGASPSFSVIKHSQNVPNPNLRYAIRIRVRNLATAPATAEFFRLHFIRLQDMTRLSVDFARQAGRGERDRSSALPVVITQPASVDVSFANSSTFTFNNSTTPLAASAVFTGSSVDTGGGGVANWRRFIVTAWADQAGTFRIEMSNDGTTWRRATADTTVPANTPVTVEAPLVTRFWRVVFTNGATAQGAFMLNSSLHRT